MPDIEKTVLSLYYHEELTLREISKIVHLHESRISQLKSQAILRLRSYMEKRWPRPRGARLGELTPHDVQNWLAGEFAARLASVFETMTGERPAVEIEPVCRGSGRCRAALASAVLGRSRGDLGRRREAGMDARRQQRAAGRRHRGKRAAASCKSDVSGNPRPGAVRHRPGHGRAAGTSKCVPQGGEESLAPFGRCSLDLGPTPISEPASAIGFEGALLDAVPSGTGASNSSRFRSQIENVRPAARRGTAGQRVLRPGPGAAEGLS